jgi:membrane-associated phospholipid phosphatase
VYVLTGYWLPARLSGDPLPRVERMLAAFDERWIGAWPQQLARRGPRMVIELLELSYLLCYPLMPLGLASLSLQGWRGDSDRFWVAVLGAGLVCYGTLPWLPTRPPRALEDGSDVGPSAIRRLNLAVLNHGSVQLNTFPSGHVATAVATALTVISRLPLDGAVFLLVALLIAAGSVVGRYHFAADAVAGLLVGIGTFAASRLM